MQKEQSRFFSRTVFCIALALAAMGAAVGIAARKMTHSAPSSLRAVHANESMLVCEVVLNDIEYDLSNTTAVDLPPDFFGCHPVEDYNVSPLMYMIDLPADVDLNVRTYLYRKENVFVEIPGGSLTPGSVTIPNPDQVRIVATPLGHERSLQSSRQPNLVGTNKMVVLRIEAEDFAPAYTSSQLYQVLFVNQNSLRLQVNRCSNGKLFIEPTSMGVVDVKVNMKAYGSLHTALMNAAEQQINSQLGYSLRDSVQHLMFVVPPGTGNWAAYATISGKQSAFNDRWATYLGAQVHEIGHNFGLRHGWQNNIEYAGKDGAMGAEPQTVNAPLECYSGLDHWNLNWFAGRMYDYTSTSPVLLKIAAYVDYASTNAYEYTVVRSGNVYVQYNRAKSYNSGTQEYRDLLTIDQLRSDMATNVLAGLSTSSGSFQVNNGYGSLTMKVCEQISGVSGSPDLLLVSFGYGTTICPTDRPTYQPTRSPTTSPPVLFSTSQLNVLPPTNAPVNVPTSHSTYFPTTSPPVVGLEMSSEMPSDMPSEIHSESASQTPAQTPSETSSEMPSISSSQGLFSGVVHVSSALISQPNPKRSESRQVPGGVVAAMIIVVLTIGAAVASLTNQHWIALKKSPKERKMHFCHDLTNSEHSLDTTVSHSFSSYGSNHKFALDSDDETVSPMSPKNSHEQVEGETSKTTALSKKDNEQEARSDAGHSIEQPACCSALSPPCRTEAVPTNLTIPTILADKSSATPDATKCTEMTPEIASLTPLQCETTKDEIEGDSSKGAAFSSISNGLGLVQDVPMGGNDVNTKAENSENHDCLRIVSLSTSFCRRSLDSAEVGRFFTGKSLKSTISRVLFPVSDSKALRTDNTTFDPAQLHIEYGDGGQRPRSLSNPPDMQVFRAVLELKPAAVDERSQSV